MLLIESAADSGLHVKPLPVTPARNRAAARSGMAKVKHQAVVTQAVSELGHWQHLDSRAVQAVGIDDGARCAGGRVRRHIPTLQIDSIAGLEFDGVVRHSELLRSLMVVGV